MTINAEYAFVAALPVFWNTRGKPNRNFVLAIIVYVEHDFDLLKVEIDLLYLVIGYLQLSLGADYLLVLGLLLANETSVLTETSLNFLSENRELDFEQLEGLNDLTKGLVPVSDVGLIDKSLETVELLTGLLFALFKLLLNVLSRLSNCLLKLLSLLTERLNVLL